MRLAALLFVLLSAGCVHEYLGPIIERIGTEASREGERRTAAIINAVSAGEEVGIKDILPALGLLLGGSVAAGGGVYLGRNGKKKPNG